MERYEIRADVLINYYSGPNYPMSIDNKDLKNAITGFLFRKGFDVPIDELYLSFLERGSFPDKLLKEFPHDEPYDKDKPSTARQMKLMSSHMLQRLDIDHNSERPFNWFIYGFTHEYTPYQIPSWGVILNQPVSVDPKTDRDYFKYFFSQMLMQVEKPEKFLDYHYSRSFESDMKQYRLFLMDCMDDLTSRKHFVTEWLDQFKSRSVSSTPDPVQLTKHVFETLRLTVNGVFASNFKISQVVGAYEALKPYLPDMNERQAASFLQEVVGLPTETTRIKKSNYKLGNPHFEKAFDEAKLAIEEFMG